jgi:hypothetical protein
MNDGLPLFSDVWLASVEKFQDSGDSNSVALRGGVFVESGIVVVVTSRLALFMASPATDNLVIISASYLI